MTKIHRKAALRGGTSNVDKPTIQQNSAKFLNAYLRARLPPSEHDEINEKMKVIYSQEKRKCKKFAKKITRSRNNVLYKHSVMITNQIKLNKNMSFKTFIVMYNVWKEYMIDLLSLLDDSGGWKQPRNDLDLHTRIARADFHGAVLTVERSTCPSFIGVTGLVIRETKNTFILLTKADKVKLIPKENSHFVFLLGPYVFRIYGNNFCVRPGERTVKKFKANLQIEL